ncbi:MAG: uroporphyrinogen-III synthase, partial [Synechococcaceae bacterium WB9_2_069]|nr:uroporphyrinogen-III synthase [Synechococcaceae bacterium WB9_2_069]
ALGSSWLALLEPLAVISIGPQTSNACRELLGRVDGEADPHDLEGLVEACRSALSKLEGKALRPIT